METSDSTKDARRAQLQSQLTDLESTLETLRHRKDTDIEARGEYYRLRAVWARKKALLGKKSPWQ